ncbi:MAG: uncharacterized protein A8A55_2337 [Amphiamblys sp. WSBS2006]|nr:MAG: uncharacterized protein A8A55_2337 [Amphiamblys sp. WSBS2006]
MHEENVMEKLEVCAYGSEDITGILKEENNSVWVGKVKWLYLRFCAMEILPKLGFHEENEIELFTMSIVAKYLTEMLKTKNNSIWIGKMKRLDLFNDETQILPKLRIHGENVMDVFSLNTDKTEHITEILKMENNSLWIGRVKKLALSGYAAETLPKLKLHDENVMEELILNTAEAKHITEILKTENSSIWVGKVKKLVLRRHTVEILPKLRLHCENVMEDLLLDADHYKHVTEILKTKKKSVWIGKVKKLRLEGDAKRIKDKLDFILITPRSE